MKKKLNFENDVCTTASLNYNCHSFGMKKCAWEWERKKTEYAHLFGIRFLFFIYKLVHSACDTRATTWWIHKDVLYITVFFVWGIDLSIFNDIMLPQINHVGTDNDSRLKLDFVCCKIFHLRMAPRLGNYLLDHVKKKWLQYYCLSYNYTNRSCTKLFVCVF